MNRPKLLRSKDYIMSNDLKDQLLAWLSEQEIEAKKVLAKEPAKENIDFYKSRIDIILNTVAFILTEGRIH